jgi:hypothetical protein
MYETLFFSHVVLHNTKKSNPPPLINFAMEKTLLIKEN